MRASCRAGAPPRRAAPGRGRAPRPPASRQAAQSGAPASATLGGSRRAQPRAAHRLAAGCPRGSRRRPRGRARRAGRRGPPGARAARPRRGLPASRTRPSRSTASSARPPGAREAAARARAAPLRRRAPRAGRARGRGDRGRARRRRRPPPAPRGRAACASAPSPAPPSASGSSRPARPIAANASRAASLGARGCLRGAVGALEPIAREAPRRLAQQRELVGKAESRSSPQLRWEGTRIRKTAAPPRSFDARGRPLASGPLEPRRPRHGSPADRPRARRLRHEDARLRPPGASRPTPAASGRWSCA